MNHTNTSHYPPVEGCKLAYKASEACDLLGISRRSLTDLINRGLIRTSRALRHHLIPADELRRFLNETMMIEGGRHDA